MKYSPTIKDVAAKAEVSVATVSRVLNNLPGFSADTEKKVRAAMCELGYRYNAIARNLKIKQTNTIAVLIPKVETTFYVKILNGIEDAANDSNYSVIVCHVGTAGTKTREYIKMLTERQIDGIIGCSLPPNEEVDKLIYHCGIPCVLVSTLSTKYSIPYVRVDDYKASYAATEYLIGKGHTHIAALAGAQNDVVAGVLRLRGYRDALADHRLPFDEDLVKYTVFSYESGLQAAQELLAQNKEFTGVVACCDEVAVAAIMAAYTKGLSVPEDFSIIGYDDTTTAKMSIPPLTTVSQPLYEMGQHAFQELLLMQSHICPQSEILPFGIVERDSVRRV